jgi:hypothetical protein
VTPRKPAPLPDTTPDLCEWLDETHDGHLLGDTPSTDRRNARRRPPETRAHEWWEGCDDGEGGEE